MFDWLAWLGQFENSKTLALLIFMSFFIGVLLYVYGGSRQRREELESHRYIPLLDESSDRAQEDHHETLAKDR